MSPAGALVTGGAGFIGRWVVAELIRRGRHVTILDDLSNSSLDNLEGLSPSHFTFVHGDVRNPAAIGKQLNGGIEACYHLAARVRVHDSLEEPRHSLDTETAGTFNVLEACRRTGCRLVYVGTCMVYDASPNGGKAGITEDDPVVPRSPYAAAKFAAEQFVTAYRHAYGLPTTIVRPFNTYGPYQRDDGEGGVIPTFLKRELDGRTLEIYGDGRQTRDFLFATDCAAAIVAAGMEPGAIGEVLNLSSGSDISVRDLAHLICTDPGRVRHVPHIHPQSEIAKLLGNSERASRILRWRPQVSLEEGIRRTRDWMRARAPVYQRG